MITAEEKDNRFGSHYVYYRCTKKKMEGLCRQRYINVRNLEPQILEYLAKIHVPDKLLYLALQYLKEEQKGEQEKGIIIQKNREKAARDCQRKLSNLNQMRLNELIDDEEYRREKRKILDEEAKLMQEQRTGSRGGTFELTVETLSFANRATDRFQNGSLESKREILRTFGSNLFLKDRKLNIDAEKPFVILEEGLKKINGNIRTLEPWKSGLVEPENEPSASQIESWCAVVEDVRTFFLQEIMGNNGSSQEKL
jgi:hypothetical protein